MGGCQSRFGGHQVGQTPRVPPNAAAMHGICPPTACVRLPGMRRSDDPAVPPSVELLPDLPIPTILK